MSIQKFLILTNIISFITILFCHYQARSNQKGQSHNYTIFNFNYVLHYSSVIAYALSSGVLLTQFNQQVVVLFQLSNWVLLSNSISLINIATVMLTAFLGHVIYKFSNQYFLGDTNRQALLQYISTCLLSVFFITTTNNLLVLLVAWSVCSHHIHKILKLYTFKKGKEVAVKKEALYSRLSELCFAIAIGLLFVTTGSVNIDSIIKHAIELSIVAAISITCLIAIAVVLKSAQIPFHGWLLKVMDAPTPISALLHAGIINIGGLLIIKLAPLMTSAANVILFATSAITTITCALVMNSQNSIKVRLAWSTAAQIGFMLLECSIGAYQLALIHIISHSLYKAHCFLYSGTAVQENTFKPNTTIRPFAFTSLLASFSLILSVHYVVFAKGVTESLHEFSTWIIGFAFAAVINQLINQFSLKKLSTYALIGVLAVSGFMIIEQTIANYLDILIDMKLTFKSSAILICFFILYFVNVMSTTAKKLISARVQIALSHGLYIDQFMTRLLFRSQS